VYEIVLILHAAEAIRMDNNSLYLSPYSCWWTV